ncbi:MAG: hydroxymethylglutaryl-CoA lyase [Proteobacteria bacterium]|nr:hydroxymethylglutaryl-CoA lyase [Pseudomonadota bacterium]
MQNRVIQLTDVTLRDGLQSEPLIISTPQKLNLFQSLLSCSYSRLEFTSFSHPKWIPQLADSEELCEAVFKSPYFGQTELMAFVPNEKGLERFLKFPIPWASFFTAASETFHQKNVNATIDAGLKNLEGMIKRVKSEKRRIRVYISTVFGCPYEGEIPISTLEKVLNRVVALEPDEIALSDTIGVASPARVEKVIKKALEFYPAEKLALHFHNTYGMALSNIAAAISMGITQFDGATGGIGGCPYAKGASGNVPTEEIAYFLNRQENSHQIEWDGLGKTIRLLNQLGLTLDSRLASVLKKGGTLYGI